MRLLSRAEAYLNGEHVVVSFEPGLSDALVVETLLGVQNIQKEDPGLQRDADDAETPVDQTSPRVAKQPSGPGGQRPERPGDRAVNQP